jgi:vacuolar-type H+-ATPase subunit F/Vma7
MPERERGRERERRGAGVWALGDASTVRAFALAGCRGCVVAAERAAEVVAQARAEGAVLLIATEDLADALERAATADDDLLPLVVFVPSAVGPRAATRPGARVARAVGRALGMPGPGRAEAGPDGA